jgi:hypothetical protein
MFLFPHISARSAKEIIIIGSDHLMFSLKGIIEQRIIDLRPDAVAVELNEETFYQFMSYSKDAGLMEDTEIKVGGSGAGRERPEINPLNEDSFFYFPDIHGAVAAASVLGIPIYPIEDPQMTSSGLLQLFPSLARSWINFVAPDITLSKLFKLPAFRAARLIESCSLIVSDYVLSFLRKPLGISRLVVGSCLTSVRIRPELLLMCPYFFMPMPMSETGIRGARMIYESSPSDVFMTGREEHMADRIAEISENRIVVVIGGMHLPGLEKEIRSRMPDSRIETITLFDLI